MGVRFDDRDARHVLVEVATTTLHVGSWRLAQALAPGSMSWATIVDVRALDGWDVMATIRVGAGIYGDCCETMEDERWGPSMLEAMLDADAMLVCEDVPAGAVVATIPEWTARHEDDLVVTWTVSNAALMWGRVLRAWGDMTGIGMFRMPVTTGRRLRIALRLPPDLRREILATKRREPRTMLGTVVSKFLEERFAGQWALALPDTEAAPRARYDLDDEIPF